MLQKQYIFIKVNLSVLRAAARQNVPAKLFIIVINLSYV